jgi:hypothetical protein
VISGDDEVIALHDPFLPYCVDRSGWAHEVSSKELRRARILGRDGEPTEERPMALREVLERIPPPLPLQLDVKAYADPGLARRTAERACQALHEHGTAERLEIMSFFSEASRAACAQDVKTRLVAWSDYAPETLAEWVLGHGMVGVAFEGFILSPAVVEPLHEAGLTISVGAVNSEEQLERLLPLRPEIIVSDRPHEIREALGR